MKKIASRTISRTVREFVELADASSLTYSEIGRRSSHGHNGISLMKKGKNAPNILKLEDLGSVLGYHLEWVKDK